jgi:hypothetical protein
VCETVKELEMPCTELKAVTTEEALSMRGKKTGLICRVRREIDNQNPEFYMEPLGNIHQQSLFGKIFAV